MNETFKISDSMSFNDDTKTLNIKYNKSRRLIGQVELVEYDALGRKVYTESGHNEIVLPGSVFVLEQLFKVKKNSDRFLHPSSIALGDTSISISNAQINTNSDIPKEKIFGFMIGTGGFTANGIVAQEYASNSLINADDIMSCIPFRITTEVLPNYYMRSTTSPYYYFAKGFDTDPVIISEFSSNESNEIDNIDEAKSGTSPILTYAKCELSISEADVREYFVGNDNGAAISQIALVAGCPTSDAATEYKDIKIITAYNFKERDLSNSKNTVKMTYKIFCI